jgi:putative addiction module component (TIGR02574 family)
MSINLADFGIDRLSEPEQIQLAEAIYIAVESRRPPQPISSELKEELDRRLEAHLQNPSEGISGDELIARAFARIQK